MAEKLRRLSPVLRLSAEEGLLPVVRDEWLAVRLAPEPADRPKAERGISLAYQAGGLPAPLVVWLRSPLEGAVGAELLRQLGSAWGQVRDRVGDGFRGGVWAEVREQISAQVGRPLRAQVESRVEYQVWDPYWHPSHGGSRFRRRSRTVEDQIWDPICDRVRLTGVGDEVWSQVWRQVGLPLRAQVEAQVEDQVWGQVREWVGSEVHDQIWDPIWNRVWRQAAHQSTGTRVCYPLMDGGYFDQPVCGQHDAGWLAHMDVFYRLGIREADRLEGLLMVARAAGWWWPLRGLVLLTERPDRLWRDGEGRLHAETGPALLYPDGFGIWAWHGVRVPREVIEQPQRLEPRQISGEANVEVRRVMVDRYGLERYLRAAEATKLDEVHEPPFPGLLDARLWRVDMAGDEPLCMVELVNSTPEPDGSARSYMLRVPPDVETAHQAVAWTFGMEEHEYLPAVES